MATARHDPLIINVCLTGMVPTKDMTPHVPVTLNEVLNDVEACAKLGATIFHVHARDRDGSPTHKRDYFAPIVEGIRGIDPSLVVCVTCSGRYVSDLEKRADVLELEGVAKPDMASLTLGSNNFASDASVNPPEVIVGLAQRMRDRGIKPELEVFEPGMIAYGKYLASKGILEEPCYVNILLGSLGTSPLAPGMLGAFLALVPDDWTWAVAGLGSYQLDANAMSLASGGHVRVGIEDNIWHDRDRKQPASNESLIRRIVELAELLERDVATPRQARSLLRLPA